MRTPRTLTSRLVATTVVVLVVVSVLVAVIATLVMRSYLTGRLDDQLAESVQRAQSPFRLGDPGDRGGDQAQGAPSSFDPCDGPPPLPRGQAAGSITAVMTTACPVGSQITSSGGRRALSSSVLAELADVGADGRARTVDLPGIGTYRVAATTTPGGATVVQGLPTADVDATVSQFVWWEALLAVVGAVVAALVGSVVVRRQLRPLRDVADTAHQVALLPLDSGEVGHTTRVPERLTDPTTEVGQVGAALNQLLSHVEQSLDARHESEQRVRRFLADASHELRTPLSTIRGYAELGRHTGTDQTAKVEEEARRMSVLVDDLLLLARLDSGRPLSREPVDVVRLVAEAVDDARVVSTDHAWRLDLPDDVLDGGREVTVTGDEQRVHQVVTNLLGNAARHTPDGTTVTTSVRVEPGDQGDVVVLAVHDDGPGVPAELLATVFERFTRGDDSRTRADSTAAGGTGLGGTGLGGTGLGGTGLGGTGLGGTGLGTSLVKAIAEAHGGTVDVDSVPGSTTFRVRLPLA